MSLLALQLIEKEKKEKTGYLELGNCGLTPDNPQLQEVWDKLGELVHLETLIFSNIWWAFGEIKGQKSQNKGKENLLNEIPRSVVDLVNLKKLVISGRHLKKWKISKLENLPQSILTLNIRDNKIENLENLPRNISTLIIVSNQISKLENLPQNLVKLHVGSNQINKIINLPQNIDVLNIRDNKIRKLENLPQGITELDVSSNKIRKIENLPRSVNTLNLRDNQITKLENLSQSITNFNIRYNRIKKIENLPQSIDVLNISYNEINKLENLPQKITYVDISDNKINKLENLPQNIATLYISSNEIKDLQPLLPFIKKGIKYDVLHNPLENPLMEVVKQGNEAILDYFKELEKHDKIPNDTLKLILIGNTTAGKTSLVKYLMHEEFNLAQNSTHGMQITPWQPEELEGININVWDFGGQEYYHATHRLFLSNNAVYILLWEAATNRTGTGEIEIFIEGLEGRQKREYDIFPYEYWLENIRYYAKDSEVFVVQNKSEKKRNMEEATLQNYGLDSDKEFHICLKKADEYRQSGEGQKRWWAAYETFKETLLDALRESVAKYDLVSYWMPIREAILAREENDLDLARFKEICQEAAGDEVEIAFDLLMIYLRDIASVILYYEEDEDLNHTVFIKPNWLNQNIYNILNYKVLDDEGEFDDAHVAHVVGVLQASRFVALMKQFGLIFDLPDAEGCYVAPQYLPKSCSNEMALNIFLKSNKPQYAFTLHFPKFLPKSVMTRFLATYGSKTQNHLFWKYGICFFEEDTGVYATYEYKENKIRVAIQNGSKRIAGLVFQTLYDIIQNDEFKVILEGQSPMLWRDLLRDSGRMHPALVQAYQHLMNPPKIKSITNMKKIFISYSHVDIRYRDELIKRLKPLLRQEKIEQIWYDHQILPGADWNAEIEDNLKSADMIFLLISDDFWASDYINERELEIAKERYKAKDCVIVPIHVRVNSHWEDSDWRILQAIPTDANTGKLTPVTKWKDADEAWATVVGSIKKLLHQN